MACVLRVWLANFGVAVHSESSRRVGHGSCKDTKYKYIYTKLEIGQNRAIASFSSAAGPSNLDSASWPKYPRSVALAEYIDGALTGRVLPISG